MRMVDSSRSGRIVLLWSVIAPWSVPSVQFWPNSFSLVLRTRKRGAQELQPMTEAFERLYHPVSYFAESKVNCVTPWYLSMYIGVSF